MYGFEKVGYNLYTYFTTGRESSVTEPFSGHTEDIYERFASNLSSSAWAKNSGDFSILSYLRKKATSQDYTDGTEAFLSENDTAEIRYGKLLYKAVQAVKGRYFRAKSGGAMSLQSFITRETWRAIMTKENYFDIIGIPNLPSLKDCKDGTKIFGTTEEVRGLKAYFDDKRNVLDFVKNQVEDVSLKEIQPLSRAERTGVVDRVDKELATAVKGDATDSALTREIVKMEEERKQLRQQIRIMDNWLAGGTKSKNNWSSEDFGKLLANEDEDEIFKKDLPETNLMNYLEHHYGTNVEDASSKLNSLKTQLAAKETGIADKETATAVPEQVSDDTLENSTFKPYNITRYAHVKKAFSKYIDYGTFTVIKNRTS